MKQDNSMENRLRKIDSGVQPDMNFVEGHWLQMRAMLHAVSYTERKSLYYRSAITRVLAGLFFLAGVVFLWHNGTQNNKEDISAQAGSAGINSRIIISAANTREPAQITAIHTTTASFNNYVKPVKSNSNYSSGKGTSLLAVEKKNNEPCKNCPAVKEDKVISALTGPMNDEAGNKQLLLQFFAAIEKPSQQFVINNYKDTSLLCREGTKVFVPANVFVNSNNAAVNGEITITIKEFYSYHDIISNKLSTTSNDRQLISGGMLYIMAMQNGKEIKLADTKKMTIKMPTADYDEQMQLFVGEKEAVGNKGSDFAYDYNNSDKINWQPAGQFQRLDRTRFRIKAFDPYGEPYESRKRTNGITVARFIIKRNCPMSNKEVLKGLKGHFGMFYHKIKLRRSLSNRPGPLFSKRKWPVVGDSVMIDFNIAKQLNLISKADIEKFEKKLLEDSARWNEKLKTIPFYEFQVGKLGFMNCDRFQNDDHPKVEFTLNLGEGEDANNFFSVLAFDKYRSVMQGYCGKNKLRFSQVPENASVHLICVGVKNGKILSCIRSLKVGVEEVSGLQFTETTPEQFKSQIAALRLKGS